MDFEGHFVNYPHILYSPPRHTLNYHLPILNLSWRGPVRDVHCLQHCSHWQWVIGIIRADSNNKGGKLGMGISLTPYLSFLHWAKKLSLYKCVTEDLPRQRNSYLSWMGRIHTTKMVVLPCILYLFRPLSIPFLRKNIKTLHKDIFTFLSVNKSPRIQSTIMFLHKCLEAVSVSNPLKYYWANTLPNSV